MSESKTPDLRSVLDSIPVYKPGKRVVGPGGRSIKLSSNESPYGPLPSVCEAITRASTELNRYPDPGAEELTARLSDRFGVPEEHIALGAGSVGLLKQLLEAVGEPGVEIVYAWRSFEAYPLLVELTGATSVQVPLTEETHDLDALADAITDKTRMVIVCNPNNPTGTTVTREELITFLDTVPSDVQVLLDEAYYEYVRDSSSPDGLGLLADYPNLAVARTFSKAYGLAGLRVGYLVGRPDFIEAVNKVCIPFSVNAVAQAAAVASIELKDELLTRTDITATQRARVLEALPEQYRIESQANYVWLDLGDRARAFSDAIADYGVAVRCFDGEGVRISVTDEAETDVLLQALDGLRGSAL